MEEQLWFACSDGKVEDVLNLLQNPQINTNWQDSQYSRTAFWIACYLGHIEIVKLLLNDQRVDINKGNGLDATPFYIACENKVVEVVKLLLNDKRVDVNKSLNSGETPLYIACWNGHTEIVKLLLQDKRIDLNKVNSNGATPFYIACQEGHIEIVKLLLNDKRVDVNKTLNRGHSPIYISCQNGRIEVVKLLLNDKRVDINKANNNGATPLFTACQEGNIEIVKYLLVSGREIDIKAKNNNGKTALEISKERSSGLKFGNETDSEYQRAKKNCPKIVALIESFQKNQSETREKLRKELESTYDIEYNGKLYILKTTAITLLELESDIRSKFKLQENIKLDLEFVRNGKYYVLEDMENLKEGMTIKASVSTQPQQNVNKIEDISNLKISSSNPSVFLTHTWVKDELNRDNHARVATVNKLLKTQGFKTWFDEDKMEGHIDQKMAEGINDSEVILVFITKVYMEKLNTKGHDNCKGEFTYAITRNKKMIPIVMEPCMKTPGQWDGPLGIRLSGDLYIDMSETDSEFNIITLVERLKSV